MKKNDITGYVLILLILIFEYGASNVQFDISFSLESTAIALVNIVYMLLPLFSIKILQKVTKNEFSFIINYKFIFVVLLILFFIFPISVGYGTTVVTVCTLFVSMFCMILRVLKKNCYKPLLVSFVLSIIFYLALMFFGNM